jgi:hypothetical protein
MMSDELNINKETICQILREDLRKRSRSNRDSHHAKASSRLVKTIQVFLIALSLGMSHWYFNMTRDASEHAVDLIVITKAQKVSFTKVQDQNHADHFF